jgi:hypothetical protein
MSTTTTTPIVPCFLDRCTPQCTTASGKICAKNTYATFNHHHVMRLITDEFEIKDMLIDLVGSAVTMCPNPSCVTKVRRQAKSFANMKATLLHHIESHLSAEDQTKLYIYLNDKFPLKEPELKDIADNVSVRSGFSHFTQSTLSTKGSMNSGLRRVALENSSNLITIPRTRETKIMSEDDFLNEFPECSLVDYFRYVKKENARLPPIKESSHESPTAMVTDRV